MTVKPNTPPLEVLYEIQKGVATGDSLRAAFKRLYQSIGCGDASYADSSEAKWARHAVQATLWTYAGGLKEDLAYCDVSKDPVSVQGWSLWLKLTKTSSSHSPRQATTTQG